MKKVENILQKEIGLYFELKEESIGTPSLYLGGEMCQVVLENGDKSWAFGYAQYVQESIRNVEEYLSKKGEALPYEAPTPLSNTYQPYIDVSEEVGPQESSYYQSLIGNLLWILELGNINICMEVSVMSSHLKLPRGVTLNKLSTCLDIYKNITMLRPYLIQVSLMFPTKTSKVKTGIEVFMGISTNKCHLIYLGPEDRESALPYEAPTPLSKPYQPYIDVSEEVGPQESSYYQSLIGNLLWILELGNINICMEVSVMSSHLKLPRGVTLNKLSTCLDIYKNITMLRPYLIQVSLMFPTKTSKVKTGIEVFMGISTNKCHLIYLGPEDRESG